MHTMNSLGVTVLLCCCLIAYGAGRPSDAEESEDVVRESKREKHYQHDTTMEVPETDTSTSSQVLGKLKSIARLRMADRKDPATPTLTREEMEALRDLLDKNLQKYQNFNALSATKRPGNDPYIGQILDNLNGHKGGQNGIRGEGTPMSVPVRRKIIRHTVFGPPPGYGYQMNPAMLNRMYGQNGDQASRIDWVSPWADYFPILIRDPFQTMLNSFSEIIEYGPEADVCRHVNDQASRNELEDTTPPEDGSRRGRAAVTPTVPEVALKRSRRHTDEEKGVLNHVKPFRPHTTTTEKITKHWTPVNPNEHNGDMGPQIKRLVVRRGGVAIAGPGGIATAGSGGTAIVGAGGSAYTSKDTASGSTSDNVPAGPQGLSMAGYGPHVVAPPYYGYSHQNGFGRSLTDNDDSSPSKSSGATAILSSDGVAYSFPVASRGLTAVTGEQRPYSASTAREIRLPDGAKLIATGPIVYYNPEKPSKKKSRKAKISKKFNSQRRMQNAQQSV
ncbi:uncharacterized protein LOC126846327 [Adelges cooleyi]|uniref:uncharacterized protein LOC126846327 n=1 Tax=Adelges cooleyi TaxID=133065 RepID=UPI00218038B5|nr:uncharacterized protein LOC126846327 [Adelges cooleyi]